MRQWELGSGRWVARVRQWELGSGSEVARVMQWELGSQMCVTICHREDSEHMDGEQQQQGTWPFPHAHNCPSPSITACHCSRFSHSMAACKSPCAGTHRILLPHCPWPPLELVLPRIPCGRARVARSCTNRLSLCCLLAVSLSCYDLSHSHALTLSLLAV